jgi:hypothetical protein
MKKIIGREPAVFFALVAGLVLAIIQLTNVPVPIMGALNGLVIAGAGLATAAMVDVDRVLPALVGLVGAVFAVFLAYGSPVPENTQAGILALITAGAAFFVRQNVVAPVGSVGGNRIQAAADAAYDHGYQSGQDDLQVPPDVPAPPITGTHADGPDFTGRLA